ncbi:DUF4401 domain-containing protein [Litoribrevibacter euphylliae]|uniref:DUF4401 domain-containing protein n=1 Tax=Litoribrevibacter euphylliae TaxID=1834034 RepID=A0ABV7HKQ1_9GAMM
MNHHIQERIDLWKRLSDQNLTEGELSELPNQISPWYVKTLMAFSGWLAALFLLGFIGVGFEFIIENSMISFFVGSGMIALAMVMLAHIEIERRTHRVSKHEFQEHLALAISLAGQCLVAFAIFDLFDNQFGWKMFAWIAFGGVQAFLAVIMPNYLHRLLSALAAVILWYLACVLRGAEVRGFEYLLVPAFLFIVCWLWMNEFKFTQHIRKVEPIAYGITLALVYIKGMLMFSQHRVVWYSRSSDVESIASLWAGELLTSFVLLYVVFKLVKSAGFDETSRQMIAAIVGCVLVAVVSLESYGFSLGVLILLVGFYCGNRLLMALGIVSLLFYISSYYYFLEVSLLYKSLSLFLIGCVLLAGRWFMHRAFSDIEPVQSGEGK